MSVFTSLTEEHRLLKELGRRLRRAMQDPDAVGAWKRTRNMLLVLLRALQGHEEFEDAVFQKPFPGESTGARRAQASLARQHAAISRLREEATALLQEGGEVDVRLLRPLVERLARMLDAHFDSEESDLWPQLNAVESRSERARVDREAAARLKELRRELESYWTAVDEYLAGDS